MKGLVIVESPAKSKTIEKYLGKDYTVTASKGHICDLAIKGKDGLGIDVEDNFKPTYVLNKDRKDTVAELKKLVAKADTVYLATDPDREGEAISWHLARELKLDQDAKTRVVFHEITKNAVLDAFNNPRTIDMNLVRSQESRRILDRILGFKLSKLLHSKIKSKSAGRVQSVALKLIVDREDEIKAFNPEEYWTISAQFKKDEQEFEAELTKVNGKKPKITNKEAADQIISDSKNPFKVSDIVSSVKNKSPHLVFTTSSLQQEASIKLGFPVKKTMRIAQELYEGVSINGDLNGLITYMRTDSTRMSPEFMAAASKMIKENYGKEYSGFYHQKNDQNAQDAHEGIRPSHLEFVPEDIVGSLSSDQYKLYRFIYYRAIAALMANAKNEVNTITLSSGVNDYTLNGHTQIFDGYLKVYSQYETSNDVILPELKKDEKLDAKKVEGKQHFTEPPLRYSEARLIKEMEKNGIGRPSTYADIIDKIQTRGYVILQRASDGSKTKVFIPTEQGDLTCRKLEEYFSSMINVKYTAEMENELDKIAEGKEDNVEFEREFYNKLIPLIDNANKHMEKIEPEKIGEKCPECGKDLVIRTGRYGKFISCSGYPECKYHRPLEEKKKAETIVLDELCPECGSPLVKRKSKYGNWFIGCSNFPKCHYVRKDESQPQTFHRHWKKKKK